ncbi:MAG TPA: PAS domain-containing sensor histidine kinase [Telluria sp.]
MSRSASVTPPGPAEISDKDLAEQFRVIAEIGGDLPFSIDCASGQLRYISPAVAALLGYGPQDFHQQLASKAADGPLAALCGGLPERLRRFAAGDPTRRRVVREFDIATPAGHKVPVEVISTLLPDGQGAPAHLVGILRDLSPRRARADEQKRFASMLNHEFRTPLSTIDGAIQRLEVTGVHADEATRQRYRKITVAVDRLIGMLDDYLSPERMETIGRQRQATSVAPRQLLEEGAAIARAAGRHVTVEAAELPAALRCEPDGLRLAIKVLLDNAIQYSPGASVIALAGRHAEGGIELAVRDSGPGIPSEEASHIFDKFYRGANAAGLPGSGLGLYMARSVIEVHGGTLSHANPAAGGSEFRIWLPIAGSNAGKHLAPEGTNSDNPDNHSGSAPGQRAEASKKMNMTNP